MAQNAISIFILVLSKIAANDCVSTLYIVSAKCTIATMSNVWHLWISCFSTIALCMFVTVDLFSTLVEPSICHFYWCQIISQMLMCQIVVNSIRMHMTRTLCTSDVAGWICVFVYCGQTDRHGNVVAKWTTLVQNKFYSISLHLRSSASLVFFWFFSFSH